MLRRVRLFDFRLDRAASASVRDRPGRRLIGGSGGGIRSLLIAEVAVSHNVDGVENRGLGGLDRLILAQRVKRLRGGGGTGGRNRARERLEEQPGRCSRFVCGLTIFDNTRDFSEVSRPFTRAVPSGFCRKLLINCWASTSTRWVVYIVNAVSAPVAGAVPGDWFKIDAK